MDEVWMHTEVLMMLRPRVDRLGRSYLAELLVLQVTVPSEVLMACLSGMAIAGHVALTLLAGPTWKKKKKTTLNSSVRLGKERTQGST